MLHDGVAQIFVGNRVAVLRGDDHAIYANRLSIAILNGDLGFSIRTEKIDFLALADFGKALRQAVGQLDGHGHQLFGFVAGVAEHQALVASAARIHAHGNVGRLALDGAHDRASGGVKTVESVVVADLLDGLANQFVVIDVRASGDFSRNHDQARSHQRFAGNTALGILPHHFIENGIGNLVGNFVRVAFRHRFGGKQKIPLGFAQNVSPYPVVFSGGCGSDTPMMPARPAGSRLPLKRLPFVSVGINALILTALELQRMGRISP